jgi:hypothetical protein
VSAPALGTVVEAARPHRPERSEHALHGRRVGGGLDRLEEPPAVLAALDDGERDRSRGGKVSFRTFASSKRRIDLSRRSSRLFFTPDWKVPDVRRTAASSPRRA